MNLFAPPHIHVHSKKRHIALSRYQAWHGLLVSKIQELQENGCRNIGDTGKNIGDTKRGIGEFPQELQEIQEVVPGLRYIYLNLSDIATIKYI